MIFLFEFPKNHKSSRVILTREIQRLPLTFYLCRNKIPCSCWGIYPRP
uniref:Uncharacterized protein n=1 Tax=Lepeophtheirus salmonis TaxID=72036 RepID=A0A0K2UZ84_LEPSM